MYFNHVVKPHTYLEKGRVISFHNGKSRGLRDAGQKNPQSRPGTELGQESRVLD